MIFKTSKGFGWPSNWDRLTYMGLDSLLNEIKQRSYIAEHEVMRRYWGLVFGYVSVSISRSPDLCTKEVSEEIANDIFLKLFFGIQRGTIHNLSKGIILKLTKYTIVDFFRLEYGRKGQKLNIRKTKSIYDEVRTNFYCSQPITLLEILADSQINIEEEYIRQEKLELIIQILYKLPYNQGRVFRLYYLKGLTLKKIGIGLGVTESRVSQLLKVAVKNIRKQILLLEV